MRRRTNVYADGHEKNVKTVMLHADGTNKLFYDEANLVPVMEDELEDLFLKGMTIKTTTGYIKPVEFEAGTVVSHDATTYTAEAEDAE